MDHSEHVMIIFFQVNFEHSQIPEDSLRMPEGTCVLTLLFTVYSNLKLSEILGMTD